MVDIQSPTAENRRGKKERRKIVTTAAKYNMGGHRTPAINSGATPPIP